MSFDIMQVLTEVYMTYEIEVQPHQLLGLILYKLGDSCQVQHSHAAPSLGLMHLSCHMWRRALCLAEPLTPSDCTSDCLWQSSAMIHEDVCE